MRVLAIENGSKCLNSKQRYITFLDEGFNFENDDWRHWEYIKGYEGVYLDGLRIWKYLESFRFFLLWKKRVWFYLRIWSVVIELNQNLRKFSVTKSHVFCSGVGESTVRKNWNKGTKKLNFEIGVPNFRKMKIGATKVHLGQI